MRNDRVLPTSVNLLSRLRSRDLDPGRRVGGLGQHDVGIPLMVTLVDHADGLSSFLLSELAHKLDRTDLKDGILLGKLRPQVKEEFALLPLLRTNHGVIIDETIVLLTLVKGDLNRVLLLVDFVDLVKERRDLLSVVEPF